MYIFILNGQKYSTSANISLLDIVNYFKFNKSLIVIEYNNFIRHQKDWNIISILNNDKIEIVTIVGGG
jgi:thiamine biosynthesis protein ThiS